MVADFLNNAAARIRVRRRPFQYKAPQQTDFDIDLRDFLALFDSINVRSDNIYIDKTVGAAIVQPLWANRDNYIVGGDGRPEDRAFTSKVPEGYVNEITGLSAETEQEINKRVFRSFPNEFQVAKIKGDLRCLRGNFVYPWENDETRGSPLWRDEIRTPIFGDRNAIEESIVHWNVQKKSNANVEWFLMQEYGNFTNESFWIDVVKHEKAGEPSGEKGDLDLLRYRIYGREIHAYFAIRIGWNDAKIVMSQLESANIVNGLYGVFNEADTQVGPYDIVFPIDGNPFIYDHQGDRLLEEIDDFSEENEDEENEDFSNLLKRNFTYRGYIASEAPDQSWIMRDSIKAFRLEFYVLRGKLIIRSSFANNAWVFPSNISPKASESTKSRYEDFFIPPGPICLMGRGFSFRFSFNPLEFNIMEDGKDREVDLGSHGQIIFSPIPERRRFPSGTGGWRDFHQIYESNEIETIKNGNHNFALVPNDTFRDPTNQLPFETLVYNYGHDIITEPYEGFRTEGGNFSSMMIGVNGELPYDPPAGPNSSIVNPKDLVNIYLRSPNTSESQDVFVDFSGEEYGFDTTVSLEAATFGVKYPVVEMNCRAPSFNSRNTFGITKRFASPVFWRMKGVHYVPEPPKPEWKDITVFAKNISYDMSSTDYITVRQNFNIEFIIPKNYQFGDFTSQFSNSTDGSQTGGDGRKYLIDLLQNGVLEVEVWLGWLNDDFPERSQEPVLRNRDDFNVFKNSDYERITINGSRGTLVRVFNGIGLAGPLNQTYSLDTITLGCVDKLHILDGQLIINSPIFDGMATDNAFLALCQLNGLPKSMFSVRSTSAAWHVLPLAFTFQQPKIRFEKNTSILEAVQKIAQYFMHVLRTDPDGKIVLGDIYSDWRDLNSQNYLGALKSIDELLPTHESYVFYVDGYKDEIGSGGRVPSPFQRIYEVFNFDKNIKDQASELHITTVDRNDGSLIFDDTAFDLASIENPDAKNFIGYSKPARYQEPALGDEKHLNLFKTNFAKRIFTAPMNIKFTTYGRPTLRPLDIIGVYHTHDLGILEILQSKGVDLAPRYSDGNYLQYRITSVRGSIEWTDSKYQFRTDVDAEHI